MQLLAANFYSHHFSLFKKSEMKISFLPIKEDKVSCVKKTL